MEQLLRVGGMLVLTATALSLAAAFLAGLYALGRHNRPLLRHAALVAVAAPVLHTLLVMAGPLLARERVLAEGSELSFCGFDCHLHVSARRGSSPDVVVLRFRSDARAVAEHPGRLRVWGHAASGVVHDPLVTIPDAPLAAADTIEHTMQFVPGARIERISLAWRHWDRYLVPGSDNPLVQARVSLALDDSPVIVHREDR